MLLWVTEMTDFLDPVIKFGSVCVRRAEVSHPDWWDLPVIVEKKPNRDKFLFIHGDDSWD